eukprot:TRINITY_DN29238_c0_g2_i1.p1 TRINITY_DN29238_c0_g2~~TRINITY_DN29238_c0_g2_i1.p1  ORF type:complete len:295 (+),score=48.13 TRINITY_DN29238_c0_g2_i1:72-956(+)
MEQVAEGIAGGIGGMIGRSTAYPFDTLKVKRATTASDVGLSQLVRRILQEEGIAGLYRGLGFSAVEALIQKFNYVLYYSLLKAAYRKRFGQEPSALVGVVCGYLADLACVPTSMPLEKMVIQLQAAKATDSRAEIIRKGLFTWEGIVNAWWSGRVYIIFSWKAGLEFAIFDRLKAAILQAKAASASAGAAAAPRDLSSGTAFLVGAFARSLATVAFYPYSRGKALSHADLAPSAGEAIKLVLRTDGFLALYKGLGMELLRGVTQASVMFAVMERMRESIRQAVLAFLVSASGKR